MERNAKLRIAYDVQPLVGTTRTGIEYVMLNVLDDMLSRDADISLLYFSKDKSEEALQTVRSYGAAGMELHPCASFRCDVYNALWLLLPVPYRWFFKYAADITHFQNNYVPPFVKGRTVATIHDVLPLLHPEWVTFKSRLRAKLCAVQSCKRADHIITVSEYSKAQIVKYCHIPPEKITVAYDAIDASRFNTELDAAFCAAACRAYKIDAPYFLYIGSVVPHKNLAMLIRAYAKALAKDGALPLLCIGGGGRQRAELAALAESLGIQDKVRLLGYVDDAYVPALMHGAEAFLFPTLYEGFGMPPLEAMACATPVLCSDVTSLPEVTGDAALLLPPEDEEAWAAALQSITGDTALCAQMRERGLVQAARFTPARMMQKVLEVYARFAPEDGGNG